MTRTAKKQQRYDELKKLLEEGLDSAQKKVRDKKTDLRTSGQEERVRPRYQSGDDAVPGPDLEVDLKVIEMKSDEISRYQDALGRLERGFYGTCSECGDEIAPIRLKALPFVVSCKDCKEADEKASLGKRKRPSSNGLFFVGSSLD